MGRCGEPTKECIAVSRLQPSCGKGELIFWHVVKDVTMLWDSVWVGKCCWGI